MDDIVLTGGPASGKTTALSYLAEKLSNFGFSVITPPEIATLVINSGLSPIHIMARNNDDYSDFQELLLDMQLDFHKKFFLRAGKIKGGEKLVRIWDRGIADGKAYLHPELFQILIKRKGLSMAEIFQLYKAVIFLVTSAKGNKDWYRKDNNPARYETAEQAIEADDKLQQAWNGHPHLILVQPEEKFDKKMHRLWQSVQRALGIPVSLEIERKFLVKTPFNPHSIVCQRIFIEQVYLEGNSGERVRMRSQDGHPIYYQTQKIDTDKATTRQEKEWQITEKEYFHLIENKMDRSRERIRKDRHCFLHKNQYFELDVFLEPVRLRGLTLLEIELTEENDQIEIPEFLGELEEVTEKPEYKNFNLAKKI